MGNKTYMKCSVVEKPEIFQGYFEDYEIPDEVLVKLSRDLGFSFDTYATLSSIDPEIAKRLIVSLSKRTNYTEINFLVDQDAKAVLGYSLDASRVPVLNSDFLKRVTSLIETCDAIKIQEQYLVPDDTKASVIVKKSESIVVDQGPRKYSYDVGVFICNDELDGTYCRLVVYLDGQPYYLPASFYNTTTNRYKKSTGSTAEALEVLVLKIIDELREDELKYKLGDFYLRHSNNQDILVTYEEYNNVLRTMMKIPSVIDDRSVLEKLTDKYNDFEKKYARLEDQKSSYIWRCTAMGDMTVGSLVRMVSVTLNELRAPEMECLPIRELIGNYLSTSRIAAEIAKENL